MHAKFADVVLRMLAISFIFNASVDINVQSSVYTSDVWYLEKGPNPSIPWIGLGLRNNLPDVGPRYPMSEVLNTSDLCGQILPHEFRGT